MAVHQILFPPEFIALQKEIVDNHPELSKLLSDGQKDLPEYFGLVAAYVGVALDGIYTPEDMVILCGILHGRLFEKRCIILR